MKQNLIQKYLDQYGKAIDLTSLPNDLNWQYALVIPACGEPKNFLGEVLSHIKEHSVLVVLIINRPQKNSLSEQWKVENEQLMTYLISQSIKSVPVINQHQLLINESGIDVLLLNFNDCPFDVSKGVGLARKIGADTALQLIQNNRINHDWIYCTDADVVLPKSYFTVIDEVAAKVSAICLDFKHVGQDKDTNKYQNQYDLKLKYYQQGTTYLGSKYNYIPLGSTLIVHSKPYAQVRGFPARSGGEDFYILNKLAKVGQIFQTDQQQVQIKIRKSERVPFGTGPALVKIERLVQSGEMMTYYHPEIFDILKYWQQSLLDYFSYQTLPDEDYGLNNYWKVDAVLSKGMDNCNNLNRWVQFIHEWFDAFKILKSVHFLCKIKKPVTMSELEKSDLFVHIMKKT